MQTILVVEDQQPIQRVMSKILENCRCNIVFAATAQEAVAMAMKIRPTMIFLDLSLPDRNGLDVLHILKLQYQTRNIPIVVMSDYEIEADRNRCMNLGCVGFITKPFTRTALYKMMESITGPVL